MIKRANDRLRIGTVHEIKRSDSNGDKESLVGWTASITGDAPAVNEEYAYWCTVRKGDRCRGGVVLTQSMLVQSH